MTADLPRVDELNSLPLRFQVAFAARCARRVRYLFKLESQSDPDAELQVEGAILSAECFATGRNFLEVENVVNEVSSMMRLLAGQGDYTKNAAARAGFSAAYAAQAASYAAKDLGPVGEHAAAAAQSMMEAVSIAEPGRVNAAIRTSLNNFEKLVALTSRQSSEPGDPIDIAENGDLGPLWPV